LAATYWQAPPPPAFSPPNQLGEVITILTEFNLGLDRHVAITLACYFVKKENQLLSIILQETKRKHFSNEMKLELVSLHYLSRYDSALCNVLHVMCKKNLIFRE
jgi:hypothetical protein